MVIIALKWLHGNKINHRFFSLNGYTNLPSIMIRRTLLLSFILVLSSCMTIGFQQPQPAGKKSLDAFPKNMRGIYGENRRDRESDLQIKEESIITDIEMEQISQTEIFLGDSLLLKKFKGFYIANYRVSEDDYWLMYPFKAKCGKIIIYDLKLGKDDAAEKLSPYTRIVRQEPDLLVIDPKRRELKRMLKDPELWEADTLYRWKR